jgi:hypothetical protein
MARDLADAGPDAAAAHPGFLGNSAQQSGGSARLTRLDDYI